MFRRLTLLSVLLGAGLSAWALRWGTPAALGVLAGAGWNILNLWCLRGAVAVWLAPSPSKRLAIVWFLVKFPLLYGLAFWLLARPQFSPVGFGVGFIAVFFAAAAVSLPSLRTGRAASLHGS